MKFGFKFRIWATASVLVVVLGTLLAYQRPVLADSATMSLNPASGNASQNSKLNMDIYIDSASPVNTASARLTYPADSLDFVSISPSKAFGIVANKSGGGGKISIDSGAFPAVSGHQLLATVIFNVKAGSGSAAVSFASGNLVISSTSHKNILSSTSGGNYTIGPSSGTNSRSTSTKIQPTPTPKQKKQAASIFTAIPPLLVLIVLGFIVYKVFGRKSGKPSSNESSN